MRRSVVGRRAEPWRCPQAPAPALEGVAPPIRVVAGRWRLAGGRWLPEAFDEFALPRVARAADVTTQTVRNHFGSKDGLLAALAVAVGEDLLERRRSAAPDDGATVAAFLAAEYEEYGRAAVRLRAASEHSAALRQMGEHGRVEHRRWLETLFGDGLPGDRRQRSDVLDSLYAATDVGTWWLLRVHLGRSRRATAEGLGRLVAGALATAGRTPS